MVLLGPIERATRLLSASSYPTHGDTWFIFLGIRKHLSRYINDETFRSVLWQMRFIKN